MNKSIVFGGEGGIGREIVSRLRAADLGPVLSVDRAATADAVLDLGELEPGAGFSRWLQDFESELETPNLFVWCAAIYARRDPAAYDHAQIRSVVDTNLTSALMFFAALTRVQRRDPAPRRLVVVGSQAGVTGGLDAFYAASKAGLVAAVKSLAREYSGLGLITNGVSPGPTDTQMAKVMGDRRSEYEEMIPVGRFNTADEVAQAVCWLLAEAPETISGSVLDIDGGLVRR
jgi:NAD(P)-dependent dehydrogenase (short-subunit alcohol dehydrogenase family)